MKFKRLIILSLLTTAYFVIVTLNMAMSSTLLALFIISTLPVFYIAVGIKEGQFHAFVSLLLQSSLMYIMKNNLYVVILIFVAVFSLIMSLMIKNIKTYGFHIAIGTLITFIFISTAILFLGIGDMLFSDEYKSLIEDSIMSGQLQNPGDAQIDTEQLMSYISEVMANMKVLFPSILLIFSAILTIVNYYFSLYLIKRISPDEDIQFYRFSSFSLPRDVNAGIILLLILVAVMRFANLNYHMSLLYNVLFMAYTAFMWQGMAVLDFVMIKMSFKLIARLFILFMMYLTPFMGYVLSLFGFLESVFKLRYNMEKRGTKR